MKLECQSCRDSFEPSECVAILMIIVNILGVLNAAPISMK
jgi:hypothetical protein